MPRRSRATSRMSRFLAACEISMSDLGGWCWAAGMAGPCKVGVKSDLDHFDSSCPAVGVRRTSLAYMPGIHIFRYEKDVDGRDKPGHDAICHPNLALTCKLADLAHSPASIFLPSAG